VPVLVTATIVLRLFLPSASLRMVEISVTAVLLTACHIGLLVVDDQPDQRCGTFSAGPVRVPDCHKGLGLRRCSWWSSPRYWARTACSPRPRCRMSICEYTKTLIRKCPHRRRRLSWCSRPLLGPDSAAPGGTIMFHRPEVRVSRSVHFLSAGSTRIQRSPPHPASVARRLLRAGLGIVQYVAGAHRARIDVQLEPRRTDIPYYDRTLGRWSIDYEDHQS
jgi:hypothetical protein